MCNRVVQNDVLIKPGEKAKVLMRGPQGEFELEFTEAVFGGPAKRESRGYWKSREGAEDVLVPGVSKFGEKNKPRPANRDGKKCCRVRHWKVCCCHSRPVKIIGFSKS
jgi:hypothetical protein